MVFIIIILLEFGIIAAWLWMKTYPLMQRGAASMGVSGAFRDTWEGLLYVRQHVTILILLATWAAVTDVPAAVHGAAAGDSR